MSFLLVFFLTSSFNLRYNDMAYNIESRTFEKFDYFKLEDFKTALGFELSADTIFKRYTIKCKNNSVVLIPGNPWVKTGDNLVNFPLSPRIFDKKFFIPLPVLNEIVECFLNKTVSIAGKTIIFFEKGSYINRIVIDPGHGGKDPGAVGQKGLKEKDVTLDIAKRAAEKLRIECGVDCILTREEDVFVSLGKRAKIANDAKASLFLSIHCNAGKRKSASGVEVYFLSPAKTTWTRAVEARENSAVEYETKEERGELESILWDLAQTEFLKESNMLADKIANYISYSNKGINRGVMQANFYVLSRTYMPACLVEIEFISNPDMEKKMKTAEFKEKVATEILKGVKEFKEFYETHLNRPEKP